jgi:hypothetical protein
MTGTLSRIPRGRNLVASHLESLGLALGDDDQALTTTITKTAAAIQPVTGTQGTHKESAPQTVEPSRKFSVELVTSMQGALLRGDLTLDELRFTLGNATLRNEDDIRDVLAETIRLKRAILTLGVDAQRLMKHVHPRTVAFLLRSWTAERA